MRIDYSVIPEATMESLIAWADHARPTGGFLEAVLSNDLAGAFSRADDNNIVALFQIVAWLWNEAPASCWGSESRQLAWGQRFRNEKETA